MITADHIRGKLAAALNAKTIEVEDDSARHAGHMGHPGHADGGTHFNVAIVSPVFAGKSRLERQRLVYSILDAELKGGVHALALITKAPGET